jgi:hypothetical protein
MVCVNISQNTIFLAGRRRSKFTTRPAAVPPASNLTANEYYSEVIGDGETP